MGSKYGYSLETINYFNPIETQDQAYTTGFIYGDGFLEKGSNRVGIAVSEKDTSILEKIKTGMNLANPINESKGTVWLRFSHKTIRESLENIGLHSNKVHTIGPPIGLDKKLIRDFIRGLFDADGSVYMGHKPYFSVVGNKPLMEFVKENLPVESVLNLAQKYNPDCYNPYKLVVYQYEDFLTVREWLYKDAFIFLQRKKDRFDELAANILI